ncbi:STAS domain-containing protein [Actinoplanes sp. NPDC049599]|uniref:STAS domain-containing protein n=1 Tax=Actinoplanes sp. NPDC049599 TaxID=3363903 RepID=UPI00379DB391
MTVASGPVTVICATGDLDMDTVQQFGRHLDRVVAAHAPELLIVDLSGLGFLGAAGIAALLAGADRVGNGGGRLRLRRLSEAARLALEATRTLDLFDVESGSGTP